MIERGDDPDAMDGRMVAARLAHHVKDPARNWDYVSFWSGVAITRLLDYQRRLEEAGLLDESGHAGEAGGARG